MAITEYQTAFYSNCVFKIIRIKLSLTANIYLEIKQRVLNCGIP